MNEKGDAWLARAVDRMIAVINSTAGLGTVGPSVFLFFLSLEESAHLKAKKNIG